MKEALQILIFTFREVLEMYNGTFPEYAVRSECLCPENYPADMNSNTYTWSSTMIDSLCFNALNESVPRVPGLSSPQSLTDGAVVTDYFNEMVSHFGDQIKKPLGLMIFHTFIYILSILKKIRIKISISMKDNMFVYR